MQGIRRHPIATSTRAPLRALAGAQLVAFLLTLLLGQAHHHLPTHGHAPDAGAHAGHEHHEHHRDHDGRAPEPDPHHDCDLCLGLAIGARASVPDAPASHLAPPLAPAGRHVAPRVSGARTVPVLLASAPRAPPVPLG